MSHEILETDAMFWNQEGGIPWHSGLGGLGVEVENGLSATQALNLVNAYGQSLNWTLEKQALLNPHTLRPAVIDGKRQHQLVRSDNNAPVCFSTEGYEVLQNHEQAALCDSLVAEGAFQLETCGSLKNGKIVWFLGKIKTSEIVPGDLINHYVFCYTAHDGSSAFKLVPTDVRVVCNNTATVALKGSRGKGISIRHTKNMRTYIDAALKQMEWVKETTDSQIATYKAMAQKEISPAHMTEFAHFVATYGLKNPNAEDNRVKNKVDAIERAMLLGDGQRGEIAGVRGTYWAAYNGMTQWINRERRTTGKDDRARIENRLVSLVQGQNGKLIADATDKLQELMLAA